MDDDLIQQRDENMPDEATTYIATFKFKSFSTFSQQKNTSMCLNWQKNLPNDVSSVLILIAHLTHGILVLNYHLLQSIRRSRYV